MEKVDVGKIVREEQTRTKDLLVKLLQPTGVVSALPVDATDFQSWLEATVDCIKEQHERLLQSHATSNSSSSSNINSSSTASQTTTTNTTTTGTSTGTSSRSDNGDSTLIANNILNNPRSIANNNSLQKNNSNDTGVVVDSNKNGAAGPAATATDSSGEEDEQQNLALRNEQLQKTLDQYKIIIADTVSMHPASQSRWSHLIHRR